MCPIPATCRKHSLFPAFPALALPLLSRCAMGRSTGADEKAGRGFSLVELVIVLGILLLALALAGPGVKSFVKGREASAAAREMLLCLTAARWKAVVSGRPVRLSTAAGASGEAIWYFLEKQRETGWEREGDRHRLPAGVRLTSTGPPVKVFHPNGTSSFGSLILTGEGGGRHRLSLNPATGRVRLWRGEKEVGGAE